MFDAVMELGEAGWQVAHCPTWGRSRPHDDLIDRGISILEGDPAAHLADPANRYDVVLVSRPHNLQRFLDPIRRHQPAALLILDSEALWWRRIERQAMLTSDPDQSERLHEEARRMRDTELACARAADFAVMVSEEERDLLIADGVDASRVRALQPFERGVVWSPHGFAQRADVGYVASWLARSGLTERRRTPLVRTRGPAARPWTSPSGAHSGDRQRAASRTRSAR